MKRFIWGIYVWLCDRWREIYRTIRPARQHYKLEIQDSKLEIGDD